MAPLLGYGDSRSQSEVSIKRNDQPATKGNPMYQTRCIRVRLKENSLERVREWAATINRRKDEALATLRDESVVIESAFLEQTPEGDFLIYFMKAESFERVAEAYQKSAHPIDEYHHEFMRETFAERKPLELLIDLDRITEVSQA